MDKNMGVHTGLDCHKETKNQFTTRKGKHETVANKRVTNNNND